MFNGESTFDPGNLFTDEVTELPSGPEPVDTASYEQANPTPDVSPNFDIYSTPPIVDPGVERASPTVTPTVSPSFVESFASFFKSIATSSVQLGGTVLARTIAGQPSSTQTPAGSRQLPARGTVRQVSMLTAPRAPNIALIAVLVVGVFLLLRFVSRP